MVRTPVEVAVNFTDDHGQPGLTFAGVRGAPRRGALIVEATEDGPASKAGIQQYSIITKANDTLIANGDELTDFISSRAPGSRIALRLYRLWHDESYKRETVVVTLAHWPTETKQSRHNTNGFRNIPWGTSKKRVEELEKVDLTRLKDHPQIHLAGRTTLAGLDTLVIFVFINDKLVRGQYVISETHTNRNLFLIDFDTLKTLIQKKYGKPDEAESIWLNDLFKSNPQSWGTAVASGHLTKHASWELDNTNIILLMTGDNFEVQHVLDYESVKFSGQQEKQLEERTLDDL